MKTRHNALLVSLAIMMTIVAPVTEAAQAPTVTINEIKTNWRRYDGRLVRVRGQLDNCFGGIYGIGCTLCPEQLTTFAENACLSLDLAAEPDAPRFDQQRSMRVVSAMQETYRFATVSIEARLDTTYLLDQNGKTVRPDPALFFDGAPSNLQDAGVLQVHSRKSARDGLNHGGTPMTLANPEEREPMLAAFAAVYPEDRTFKREAFAIESTPAVLELRQRGDPHIPDGVVCMCYADDCQDRWPRLLFYGMKSPANPFRCWTLQKIDGQWRLLLSWD